MNQSKVAPIWIAIPGWTDDQMFACYDLIVAGATNGDTIVEVGSFLGRSLCYLCSKIVESKKKIMVYSVDLFPHKVLVQSPENEIEWRKDGGTMNIVWANVMQGGFQSFVTLIRGDSADIARLFDDNSLYAAFIDADHTQPGVLRDLRAWLPKVRSEGIVAGHDYEAPDQTGVKAAVDEVLGVDNISVSGTTWIYRKP